MAAAVVIPAVLEALKIAEPLAPHVISFVQTLFGKGNGDKKKAAAVDMLKAGLDALANAGLMPSAGVVDPSLLPELGKVVQKSFDSTGGNVPVLGAPAPVPSSGAAKSMVVSGAGRTLLIVDLG